MVITKTAKRDVAFKAAKISDSVLERQSAGVTYDAWTNRSGYTLNEKDILEDLGYKADY